MHKSKLPSKLCCVCLRNFNWRKKWERDWDNVKYCSKKCQQKKKIATKNLKLADKSILG